MSPVEQCPITGDPCTNRACSKGKEGCVAAVAHIADSYANDLQNFPKVMADQNLENAIQSAAARLGIDPQLLANAVTDVFLGPGAATGTDDIGL